MSLRLLSKALDRSLPVLSFLIVGKLSFCPAARMKPMGHGGLCMLNLRVSYWILKTGKQAVGIAYQRTRNLE